MDGGVTQLIWELKLKRQYVALLALWKYLFWQYLCVVAESYYCWFIIIIIVQNWTWA